MKGITVISLFLIMISSINAQYSLGLGVGNRPGTRMIQLDRGSLESLKDYNFIRVDFDYSNMTVNKDFTQEEVFVKNKANELNLTRPGKGDKWINEWYGKRAVEYEPNFELLFNKYIKPLKITCGRNYQYAELVMTVHTLHTNIITAIDYSINSITYISSYINAEITFSLASTDQIVASFTMMNFTAETISEAYSVLGKYFAKYLVDEL